MSNITASGPFEVTYLVTKLLYGTQVTQSQQYTLTLETGASMNGYAVSPEVPSIAFSAVLGSTTYLYIDDMVRAVSFMLKDYSLKTRSKVMGCYPAT